jgi:hypothetical protein
MFSGIDHQERLPNVQELPLLPERTRLYVAGEVTADDYFEEGAREAAKTLQKEATLRGGSRGSFIALAAATVLTAITGTVLSFVSSQAASALLAAFSVCISLLVLLKRGY